MSAWAEMKCCHGKLFTGNCVKCEELSIRQSLAWMEPRVKKLQKRLKELNEKPPSSTL